MTRTHSSFLKTQFSTKLSAQPTAKKTIKLTYYHLGVYTADDASKLDKFESDFLYWVFTVLDDGYSLWTCYFVYSYVYLFFFNDGAF